MAQAAMEMVRLMHGETGVVVEGHLDLAVPSVQTPQAVSHAGPGIPGYAPATIPAAAARHHPPALFVGGHRVPGDMRLADSPVMDGCVVSLGDPAGCPLPEPAGLVELRVAGGPAAGGVFRLSFGRVEIGGPASAATRVAGQPDIVIADPAIPPLALQVIVGHGGVQLALAEDVQILLDGQPIYDSAWWCPGQQVAVGKQPAGTEPYEPPDAALHPSEDGGGWTSTARRGCCRRTRMTRFQLPVPPAQPERRPVADPDGHRAGGHGRRAWRFSCTRSTCWPCA